ncbi:kinase-like domain-containing protein [Lasiosphaeria miniovina]|uniref:Autophagy-related protein 1 n=1 Tax=Lasiosphaeria miniovina TaxID=1954250 RepID=A0AA40DZW1_9PEZI|nr:kinase-like domain-containing protein [Lasiosphaeria miniovina]KAK0722719.1 kinase-like domain-containing protein [Lasiosphaeria miniovina]
MECLRNNFSNGVVIGGRYQTLSPLNHGSFGMVFTARDLRTNQTVAIKCLTKRTAANDGFYDFAIDDKSEELVLHRRLGSHPNIVNLLDSYETDAHIYLILEFCPRGDLYEAIRIGHGPLETEHVRQFMLELIDAVDYMHDKGIYHRDIKPENIFLTQSGSMKLGDFGLATTENWTYETTVGSDRYMSPEQYDSAGAGYSPAQADIWAIGVCLLNILFSRNPFSTPTESDPLFLDFSRDKQSLFDVFPSMSQDTYEVIAQCMSLDPRKRSLAGARDALLRVISFTTLDEALDDFCSADRRVVASANREPLRTPSIQSPQTDAGVFPWAKALQTSPQKPIRQLSVIADDESYSEDLFSKSGTTTDWLSGSGQTPSMSSMLDSSLGASMQSLNIGSSLRPKLPARALAKVSPMAGSLPIHMSKTRNQSAMSWVFGRKDAVSKSWSDLWDEEVEEEEQAQQMQSLKEMNSRTWSHESQPSPSPAPADDDYTPRLGLSPATKSASLHVEQHEIPSIDMAIESHDVDEDLATDGLFFYEPPTAKEPELPTRYSPPPKRGDIDRWAALGERRRAYTGSSSPSKAPDSTVRHMGVVHNAKLSTPTKERAKECPRTKGRDRDWNWNFDWRKEKRNAFGDIEWDGGWQETHS